MICQRYDSVLSHQYQMFKVNYLVAVLYQNASLQNAYTSQILEPCTQGLISSPYYNCMCKQDYVWCISENRLPFYMTATQIIAWFRAPNIQITSAKN